jgi:type I restriction enzyme S subunit
MIEEFHVPCPSLQEQNQIVEIVGAYDDLIENNRRRMALLEESARLLYQEWFVRFRFPGHEHVQIKNGVPEGWERLPFDQALELQRGFDLPTEARQDGDIPIYGSTGIVGFHNSVKVEGPGLVTGRSGTLGEVHYISGPYWPLNTALWCKSFHRVTPLYALFLLREMDLKQYNGGASVPTLDRKAVHRLPVLVPPRLLISRFDKLAGLVFRQIRVCYSQNERLAIARNLLLPQLMSGEVAV